MFLLDTGATTNFVDTDFTKAAAVQKTMSEATIRLADGEVVDSAGITDNVLYELTFKGGGTMGSSGQFEVTKLGGYDVILGMPWFRENKPRFVWDDGPVQMEVRRKAKKWET